MAEKRRVHVVLVEDNVVDVEGVRRAFDRHGIESPIHVARDGREGLALLRSGAVPRPYVVLLDLNLPRMNGIEMLSELRADPQLSSAVVFVLTTSQRDEDLVACYDLHVAGYIVKADVGKSFANLADLFGSYADVVELLSQGATS